MNFERNTDPKKSLDIGLRAKRAFKTIEEAVDWVNMFPEVISDGNFSTWEEEKTVRLPSFYSGQGYHSSIPERTSNKLQMVKWIKDNIKFEGEEQYKIGLKDSKRILDRAYEKRDENKNQ